MIEAGFEVDEIIVDFLEVDGMECNEWADPVHTMMTLGGKGANVDLGEGWVVQIPELIGDFSLNAINTVTSSEMLVYGGLSHITTGYDLSADSIMEQAKAMDGGSFNKARGNCPYTPTYFSYRGKFSSA